MKTHIQIVAVLHIALGLLSLLTAIAVFVGLALVGGVVAVQPDQGAAAVGGIFGVVAIAVGCFLTLLALPGIIGGWALLTGRSWARPLMLVVAALHLFHVPVGTALGIYTFWVLLSEPKETVPTGAGLQPGV